MTESIPQPNSVHDRFDMLMQAGEHNALCLVKCNDGETGKFAYLLCAVRKQNEDDVEVVPLARMFDDENPFELYIPPLGFDEVPTAQ